MKPAQQIFGTIHGLAASPIEKPKKALVLLHGVGSNEEDLLGMGSTLAKDRLVVSLRAPLILGQKSFASFQFQVGP